MKRTGLLKCCGHHASCPYPVCVDELTVEQRSEIEQMRRMELVEEARAAGARTAHEIAAHMGVGVRTVHRTLSRARDG